MGSPCLCHNSAWGGRARMQEPEATEQLAGLGALWRAEESHPFHHLLPRDGEGLRRQLEGMRAFLSAAPVRSEGTIDPAAIVRGQVVHCGAGSVIEAGAVIHDSCRLYLGANSRVRSGAVLR